MPSDKKRPRKQPPNQVWLDAIMSTTRSSADPSSSSADNSTPHAGDAPPLKQMRMMHAAARVNGDEQGPPHWPMKAAPSPSAPHHLPPRGGPSHDTTPRARSSSRTPSPAIVAPPPPPHAETNPYIDQLAVDDAALVSALLASLKELIADQDCSFIARGVCHMCSGDKEKKLVPVVNFCPDFSPTHSLCREHLRSMHRVRLVDIFAGKNQPTVSKRALRCSVCSLSCPCSKCQLRRDAEISKYKQWLAGTGAPSANGGVAFTYPSAAAAEGEDAYLDHHDDEAFAMGPRTRSARQLTPPLPPPPTGYEEPDGHRRPLYASRDHAVDRSDDRRYAHHHHAEEKRRASDRPRYYGGEEKSVSERGDGAYPYEETGGSLGGVPPAALRADEKGGGASYRSGRFPKRAAKDSVAYPRDASSGAYAPPLHGHHSYHHGGLLGGNADLVPTSADLASPSAASVLNCPDSEKSLVDLLSSLNQRVTPAVRYFADADEPRFRDMMEEGLPRGPPTDRMAADTMHGHEDYETTMRRQKRKRESGSSSRTSQDGSTAMIVDVDDEDDAPLRRPGGVRSSTGSQDGVASYRQKAPTPLGTQAADRKPKQPAVGKPPSPSPRGRPSGKTKGATAATTVLPSDPKGSSSRKRDPPTMTGASHRKTKSEPPIITTERTTPRGTAHRGHSHKPSTSGHHGSDSHKRKQNHRSSDGDEEMKESRDQDEEIVGDDDDDSETDTNLDYCEVCLAAGDLVCCDVCPRSFHLKCLKMTEDDLPEGDWQCAECRKPSYFESFGAAVAKKTTVPAKCLQIIQCLKSHPFAKPFLLPVEDVPHYSNIVKQPMDLSTIETKLVENKYTVSGKGTMQAANGSGGGTGKILHLGAFAEDVRRVWANCKLFNDDGSGITRAADQLSDGFEKLYRDVVDFVEQSSVAKPAQPTVREEKRLPTSAATGQPQKVREAPASVVVPQTAVKAHETKSTPPVSTATPPPSVKPTGDSTKLPAKDSVSKDLATGSGSPPQLTATQSVVDKPAAPSAPTTTVPSPSASKTETAATNGKNSSASSTVEVASPPKSAIADKGKPLEASAAQPVSPSPATTAPSTPSPTESTTSTFTKPITTTSVASTEKKPVENNSIEKSAVETETHTNGTKGTEASALQLPSAAGGEGGATVTPQEEPTK